MTGAEYVAANRIGEAIENGTILERTTTAKIARKAVAAMREAGLEIRFADRVRGADADPA